MATPLSPVLDCTEFVAAEGRYELLQDIFLDQVLPHPVIHTYVSSVSVKYKDYPSSNSAGTKAHAKQASSENTLTASNIDRLEERLKDFKLKDERGNVIDDDVAAGAVGPRSTGSSNGGVSSKNFHGNLVDLPLYNEDPSNGYKSPRNGIMSPGLPQVITPGPPPLKDSTSSNNRHSDPYSQYGPPPPMPQPPQLQQQHSFSKSLSRASSYYSQGQEDNNGLSVSSAGTGGSSAGFSSFFSGKRKKPKNNITKTNSTFVTKITTHENLAKILANRAGEDVYLFWNTGKTFTWSDLGQKPNEPLSHILFSKAFPSSHDVNVLTRSCDHLDVIIGFSTGDIIWFDPLCNKYYRLNKQAIIKDSAVTMIKWMPGSESQFMAAFHDGSILIMDKERDDNAFSVPASSNENTGGQDDLVTIWSFKDQRIVARCQGHQSYVTGVAFDPWRCDERNYRFGSVGEDAKLLLWDFSVSALHKPKAAIAHRRGSNATVLNMAGSGSAGYKPGHASKGSISSLRGSGGHSLFSGHHTSKPSTAQPLQTTPTPAPAAAISSSNHHHYHQHPPAIAEEPSPELVSSDTTTVASLSQHSGMSEPHPMASAGGGNSSSMFSIYSSTPASDIGRSRAFSASTAMTSSAAGIKTFSSSPSSSNNSDINNASSSNAVYKKSSHARTLPHLHLSKQQAHYPDNTYGGEHMNSQQQGQGYSSSSIFRSNSNVQSNGSVQLVRPPEPRSHVAMLQPLMVKSVHQEPLASITFREDAIMTSDRRGHIKVWKRPPVSPQHR
ncbi:hypothetical protein BX616_006465 [Lobosporangium transversale]|nr:hypothetical protein BX616_006465 [Lobosporangium transversale]